MPSSVGHALGAIIVGRAADRRPASRWQLAIRVAILAALGAGPDLDLLIGRHRAETHSLGAAVIVATIAALMRWPIGASRLKIFLVAASAWSSHLVLDMLGQDHSYPYGVELFWPLSNRFFITGWDWFLPISRTWYSPRYVPETLAAITREVMILGPVLLVVVLVRKIRH